ncbi:hypothetical protein DM02DRAFT_18955 [Periconia macrospinosa]|uniref:Uncharacterized protein n=1 Tax=Periconia macrospinosa TaxID=97972 RepID=A0A2V1DLX6_9PLEO|nr:hypothetical protein DM02DRAFT_18955 [Periconia macrospinosa]
MGKKKLKALKKAETPSLPPIPDPFEPAPSSLAPLLDTFDIDTVYITHIDKHPAAFKKSIFYVPVGLNLFIAALLLLRAYYAAPLYWKLVMSILNNHNETTLYWESSPKATIAKAILWRMCMFMFDFMIFRVVGPWPLSFFLEMPGNPVLWRFRVGFRDEEVYVRESRGWGAEDLLGEAEGSSGKAGSESPFFKTRILPAVDIHRLRAKSGYMLMDKDFDLDFGAMITATRLLDKKQVTLNELNTSVFVWVGNEEGGQWAVWNCGVLDDGAETEARKKIVMFKDELTRLGKESLFFKWIELVQFESSAPGGFTQERQVTTAEKTRKLFEAEGIDFDKFSAQIGGFDGMPGM